MRLLLLLSFPTATAASIEAYPLRSEVTLAPEGVTRLSLPPELIGASPNELGRTLRVQNADGTEVPFATILSTQNPEPTEVALSLTPTGPTTWLTGEAGRPIDYLQFDVARFGEWPGAWLTVSGPGWTSRRTFVYEGAFEGFPFSNTTVDVGHRAGPFVVTVETADGGGQRIWDVTGYVRAPGYTPPRRELLAAGEPVLTEQGAARWTVDLPGARAVTGLRIEAEGDVYLRAVRVGVPTAGAMPSLQEVGSIRRLQVGEASIDQDRVAVDLVGDTLLVEIDAERGVPLPVVRFEVESVGAEILVREPGPGPHAVLGGTYDHDQVHDLGYAASELLRGDTVSIEVPPPTPHAAYVPLPTRDGVDAPGATVNLARFKHTRPIVADAGWVRIPLDATVLGHARADLGDVRVIDSEGRAVPFLLRSLGAELPVEVTGYTREELGRHSQIRVPLLAPDAPLATLTLHTPASRFSRSVSILRDRGRMTETVRSVQWGSDGVGSALAVSLYDRFGAELLVDIDNGDNSPLPIDRIVVSAPAWELRTRIPEGGARLVYGAPGERAPQWDLGLLDQEVWRMPLVVATLGAEAAQAGPSLSGVEKLVVVGAIALLAIGLVGMTVRALRTGEPVPAD